MLSRLRVQLAEEGLTSVATTNLLDNMGTNLSKWTAAVCARHLWRLMKDEIQKIDTEFLVELLKKNKEAAKQIEGKDVILLLGNTGSGKSTTIHFLGGSTMRMIDDKSTGKDHLEILHSRPQLESFVTSARSTSETLNINAIDLEADGVTFTLCDTPGFGDNRGDEIDISNGLGITDAVRGCRSVRAVFLISFPTFGDRLDGVVNMLKTPIAMMSPVQQQLGAFSYWFTKFPRDWNDTNKILLATQDKLDTLQLNSCTDDALLAVLQDMVDKIGHRQDVAVMLDPVTNSSTELLQDLLHTPAINNPESVFQNFATGDNLNKLNLQLGKHLSSIDIALSHNKFRSVAYKLSQLKTLQDCLQLEDCRAAYAESLKKVRSVAETLLTALYDRMQPCAAIRDKSIKGLLRKSAADTCTLFELDAVRAEHFPEIPHFPSSCSTLITGIQRELASVLHSLAEAAFQDALLLIENKEHYDFEAVAAQLDTMTKIIATFTSAFRDRGFDLDGDADVKGLLDTLTDIYIASQSSLKGLFSLLESKSAEFLAAHNVAACVQCLDRVKVFAALYPQHLDDAASTRKCADVYLELKVALFDSVKAHYAGAMLLLDTKRLSELATEEVSALQVAVNVLLAAGHASLAAHFDIEEYHDSLDAYFGQLVTALHNSFARTQTELREVVDNTPGGGAFAVIKARLQVLILLREDPTLCNHTIQAFSDVAETVKSLVAQLCSDVNTQLALLKGTNWNVSLELFTTLEDLPGNFYKDEFWHAESRLRECLAELEQRINDTEISVAAPDTLASFLGPVRFVLHLKAFYLITPALLSNPIQRVSPPEVAAPESAVEASAPEINTATVCEVLSALEWLFAVKLSTLMKSLEVHFPLDGDLSAHRPDLDLLWAATRLVQQTDAFHLVDTASMVQRVKASCAAQYAQLGAMLDCAYAKATDETAVPEDSAADQKKTAAAQLADGLTHIRRLVRFYTKQSKATDGAVETATGTLASVVFMDGVAELFTKWWDSSAGKITHHLERYRADCERQLDFEVLNAKWSVARAMGALDAVIKPTSATKSSTWVGYGAVADLLREQIRKVNDTVSLDIKAENFAKVREFFSERDLKDPAQAAALSTSFQELTDRVGSISSTAQQKAGKLVLTLGTVYAVFPLLEDLHKLQGAIETVYEYLLEPVKSSVRQEVWEIEQQVTAATRTFLDTADEAISRGDFAHAEQVLQSVQQIMDAMYGSLEKYADAMSAASVPVEDRIDLHGRRAKVKEYVANVRGGFDVVFQDLMADFNANAATTEVAAPSSPRNPKSGAVAESKDYSQLDSIYSTVSSAAQFAFGLTGGDTSADGASDASPPGPVTVASSSNSVDLLKQSLSHNSPKDMIDSLSRAATFGQADFYQQEEELFCEYLGTKLLALTAYCKDPKVARDQKDNLVLALQESLIFLPAKLLAEVSVTVNDCAAVIKAEKDIVERQLEEAKQTDDLCALIDGLASFMRSRHYHDCNIFKRQITAAVRRAVMRFEEDLKTGKISLILKNLPKAWREWEFFFDLCYKLNEDYYFRLSLKGQDRVRPIVDQELINMLIDFARNFGIAIKKLFSEIQNLPQEDPRLFPLMTTQFDLLMDFRDNISSVKAMVHLATHMRDKWAADEVGAFFTKVVLTFKHFSSQIETLAVAAELDPVALKSCLECYSHSDSLHAKLVSYCATPVSSKYRVLTNFPTECKSFAVIKDGVLADVFTRMAATVKPTLLHNSALETPNPVDRTKYYAALYQAYKNLSRAAVLQPYANPAVVTFAALEKECDSHLIKELQLIGTFLTDQILGGSGGIKESDHDKFSIWYGNLCAAKVAFDNTPVGQEAANLAHKVHTKFMAVVAAMANAAAKETNNEKFLQLLFPLKQIAVNISLVEKEVNKEIDHLLNQVRTDGSAQRIVNLGVLLNSATNPMAQMIVQDHKAFEGNQLLLFNTKVARFTEDNVLSKEKGGIRGTAIGHAVLKAQYLLFNKEYQGLVVAGLPKHKEAAQQCVAEAKRIAADTSIASMDKARRLMVQLFVSWTLSNAEHYFDAVDISSAPGERAPASAEDQEKQRKYLKQPHAGQIISIFRMLGFDDGGKLQNHFVQISTGEGKSVILAITSCIFALLGYTVNCACYSEYLSNRDHSGFKQLFNDFGVFDFVVYDTFHQLCERYLNATGDIREGMQSIIHTPTGQPWNRGSAQPSRFAARKKVLLIDEVDVFFNKDFYGSAYRPLAKLVDPTVIALLDAIWKSRASKLRTAAVKALPEYKACVAKFTKWEFLLEESVKTMLGDLLTFESHEVKIVGDRIGYKDQDKVSYDITYGYKTLFAYYKANAEGKISATSLQSQKYITIDCGSYSFAEIPKLYDLVLGVSGTLETLSQPEQRILQNVYKIGRFTYTPSVYGTNDLDFHGDNGRDIKIDTDNAHFAGITNEINVRRTTSDASVNRPVLVFFETTALLLKYYNDSAAAGFKAKLKMVTEEVSESDKDNVIRLATSPDSITLLSREFGRGTDFIIYDDRINRYGGVHVIQTFLSEELSEETQIKGRAARQGCKGSFSMVLSELSLEKFGIKKEGPGGVKEMKNQCRFLDVLTKRRDAFFADKYQDTIKYVEQIEKDHKKAMAFLADLATVPCKTEGAKYSSGAVTAQVMANMLTFLAERNKSPMIEAPAMLSRTIVLMDATGSMSSVLSKTKNTVKTMFTRAQSVIAQAKGVAAAAFEIQFVVYRNYNAPIESLLQASGWESNPDNLFQFMDTISAQYGLGNEAVEIGFWHANNEIRAKKADQRYQVILIGDMPPNTAEEVTSHRSDNRGESYWASSKFGKATYYMPELQRLVEQGVPVHAFYVDSCARSAFEAIARGGKGKCKELDINSNAGAETLTDLVTEEILNDVAGGGAAGQVLIEDYRRMFGKGYTK